MVVISVIEQHLTEMFKLCKPKLSENISLNKAEGFRYASKSAYSIASKLLGKVTDIIACNVTRRTI